VLISFISLRGEVGAHKTSSTPPHIIEVPVSILLSERSFMRSLAFASFYYFSVGF